jgi:hypothetical protein
MPDRHSRIKVTKDPDPPPDDPEAQRRLEELAAMFANPETALWDWDVLREQVDARRIR